MTAQTGFESRTAAGAVLTNSAAVFLCRRVDGNNAMGLVAKLHRFRESVAQEVKRLAELRFDLFLFCHCDSFLSHTETQRDIVVRV